ncbi:hypothetical protein NC651_038122 [Populus alba x Populus x berolinensis]|nr:hypothetical protein NC651_038122 [Populus alba x Populus x berolinensis]
MGFDWQKQLSPSIHPINCSKSGRQVYSALPGEVDRSSFISQSEEGKGWTCVLSTPLDLSGYSSISG